MGLLSTHANRQGVDISVTVCLFVCLLCVFVWLRLIKLVAPILHSGSSASWTQNLSFWGTLLPRRFPKSDESASFGRNAFLSLNAIMPARYMLSSCVRPSVCPSVTSRHCTKTAKHRLTEMRHTIDQEL